MKVQVHIVGPLALQNELICHALEKEMGLRCSIRHDLDPKGFTDEDEKKGRRLVILCDCRGIDMTDLLLKLGPYLDSSGRHCFVALFNLSPDPEICKDAVKRGIRGIFFEEDHLSNLSKGILAILRGELWFSREILARCLLETPESSRPPRQHPASLTRREGQILLMIAHGATNEEIAAELYISLNTVKTHLHNIFKKIGTPNRLQASLWAAKNLLTSNTKVPEIT
jgi:DNA-binding NarL/FixJ family response regulator